MSGFLETLQTSGHGVAFAVIILFSTGFFGILLGELGMRGIKLGIGGALFAGIIFGHFGISLNSSILYFTQEFGLILFVYSIGIQVGPGFFASLKKNGMILNGLAVAIVLLGSLVALVIHFAADVNLLAILGVLSGATTNTPSLAAAQQVLAEVEMSDPEGIIGMAYAIAYPFGIIGILVTMLAIRFFLGIKVEKEAQSFEEQSRASAVPIESMNIIVTNPNLFGIRVADIPGMAGLDIVISRILHGGSQKLAVADHKLSEDDILLAVGTRDDLNQLRLIVGKQAEVDLRKIPSEVSMERIVVTNHQVLGKHLYALKLRAVHGVTVSRIVRSGIEFVSSPAMTLQFGDTLTVIGSPDKIREVAKILGDKPQMLNHAQIAPIFIGIALGVLLGQLPVHVPGLPAPLKLGLAGGPLIAAILLSRLGHFGSLVWFMPQNVNLALREIGIVLFLSCVGLKSGGRFVETLIHGEGMFWIIYGILITLIPLVLVGFAARMLLKLNYLTLCGVLAGSMTDPPALAFANGQHESSNAAALSYATVYPLTMFLRVMSPQIIVLLLIL